MARPAWATSHADLKLADYWCGWWVGTVHIEINELLSLIRWMATTVPASSNDSADAAQWHPSFDRLNRMSLMKFFSFRSPLQIKNDTALFSLHHQKFHITLLQWLGVSLQCTPQQPAENKLFNQNLL